MKTLDRPLIAAALLGAFLYPLPASAASLPKSARAIPAALQPGATTALTLHGENLEHGALWTSFPIIIEGVGPCSPTASRFLISLPMDAPRGGIGLIRIVGSEGASDLLPILIDDLPILTASSSNRAIANAQPITQPIALDGQCEPRQADYYRIQAQAGDRLEVDVVAARLGSQMDPLLRLLDETGLELAYCDDGPDSPDPVVTHVFSKPATCLVEVRDTRYEGGAAYHYHLRVSQSALAPVHFLPIQPAQGSDHPLLSTGETEPNDELAQATPAPAPTLVRGRFEQPNDKDFFSFKVEKDSRWRLAGRTRSIGSPCDLYLELLKADGTSLAKANLTGLDEGTITNTFAEAGAYVLLVEEVNRLAGPDLRYELALQPLPPGFELSVETDRLQAAPGQEATLKVNVARRDYKGPIELSWIPENLLLNGQVIPEKESSIELKTIVPKEFEPGQWLNLRLRGHARINEQPFSAQAQTLAVIKKTFPVLLYPPTEFDGLITLSAQ